MTKMRTLKFTIFAAAMLAGVTAVKAQNADDIIQKHIDAMGGKNWDKIKTLRLTGTSSIQGTEVSMTQTMVSDKAMRMDFTAMGMSGWTIITPEAAWAYQPGMEKPMSLPKEQLNSLKGKINFKTGQLVDKSTISKSEFVGRDTISSVPCYKVKVTDKDGNIQTAYIDIATYYMVRSEAKIKIQEEEQEIAVNYSNFKKQQEGIVFPMTVGSPQGDITFKSIEINKPIDESIFKPDVETKKTEVSTKKTDTDSKTKK
jgi:hypothetical protein